MEWENELTSIYIPRKDLGIHMVTTVEKVGEGKLSLQGEIFYRGEMIDFHSEENCCVRKNTEEMPRSGKALSCLGVLCTTSSIWEGKFSGGREVEWGVS